MNPNAELVRQLLALLTTTTDDAVPTTPKPLPKPIKNRYVIVRGSGSGVHAGYLESQDGSVVRLSRSRRLWQWRVPMGAPSFLSGVATHGIDQGGSKIGTPIDLTITDACEVIDASEAARASIQAAPEVERTQ